MGCGSGRLLMELFMASIYAIPTQLSDAPPLIFVSDLANQRVACCVGGGQLIRFPKDLHQWRRGHAFPQALT